MCGPVRTPPPRRATCVRNPPAARWRSLCTALAGRYVQLAVTSSATVVGTTEYAECAGRGICDRDHGSCKCFLGFGSSDGLGNAGGLANCGYREPFVPVDTSRFRPYARDGEEHAHASVRSYRRTYGDAEHDGERHDW